MAEQKRKIVADTAFDVVKVGMTHPASCDIDDRLAWAGIGHDDRLDRYRTVGFAHHNSSNFRCHRCFSPLIDLSMPGRAH
jgi:hypothetical protein